MKTHERLLTTLETSFVGLPARAQTEGVGKIAPVIRDCVRVLGRLDKDHPEISNSIKRLWPVAAQALVGALMPGGGGMWRLVDNIGARAPDLAPTLYAAIREARR